MATAPVLFLSHGAPLFALGAADESPSSSTVDGFWFGLSKRSRQLG